MKRRCTFSCFPYPSMSQRKAQYAESSGPLCERRLFHPCTWIERRRQSIQTEILTTPYQKRSPNGNARPANPLRELHSDVLSPGAILYEQTRASAISVRFEEHFDLLMTIERPWARRSRTYLLTPRRTSTQWRSEAWWLESPAENIWGWASPSVSWFLRRFGGSKRSLRWLMENRGEYKKLVQSEGISNRFIVE